MNILKRIELHEGYKSKPYQDSKKVWTIGIGFTYLTLEESRVILAMRVGSIKTQISNRIKSLSKVRQDILVEMAFQMGIKGLYNFKRMWSAIDSNDFKTAYKEMLDSQWAKTDSPNRAKEMAKQFLEDKYV